MQIVLVLFSKIVEISTAQNIDATPIQWKWIMFLNIFFGCFKH